MFVHTRIHNSEHIFKTYNFFLVQQKDTLVIRFATLRDRKTHIVSCSTVASSLIRAFQRKIFLSETVLVVGSSRPTSPMLRAPARTRYILYYVRSTLVLRTLVRAHETVYV
jgi:hypothetical protein